MYTGKRKRNVLLLVLMSFFCNTSFSQYTGQLIPKKGLYVTTNGFTWLTGSEISFFTPDKKHHHYFFTWWEQDLQKVRPGRERLFIGSKNTAVYGTYDLSQKGSVINTNITCNWNLQEPGVADVVYAKLWLPFFSEAVFSSAAQSSITEWSSFNDTTLHIKTSFGNYRIKANHPFRVKTDANLQPGELDYTRRTQYLILFEKDIPVTSDAGIARSFSVEQVSGPDKSTDTALLYKPAPERISVAWQPHAMHTRLLPQPKSVVYQQGKYVIPATSKETMTLAEASFRELLKLQWQLGEFYFPLITARENTSLPAEGYVLSVNGKGVDIQYQQPAGLQHALHTLVQLVKNEYGNLVLPYVEINDWPSVSWRGIHMFTGPESWALHKRMYDRVLLPLKMNKVVLQCEQAQWKSRPELHNPISVPMDHLREEFGYLRKNNNEPIPLIQSLGHMEWFFKPKKNRKLAVNPSYPYTINPELKAGRTAVRQLWDETFAVLQPKTMHIGFDEIGMIGFHLPRNKEVEYFKLQIDWLHKYAVSKNATLMIWGDMGLGPGEGPDALNGVTKERAAAIRSFIPEGTYVADWHYINNPDPEVYKTNLRIWKENKNQPLASPWLWPNNVRGFVQAAIDEQAGVLQTTWADFESSEQNMLLHIEQFGAYVLAMDNAWSGRKELPAELPYHPVQEWVSRFYAQAHPVQAASGLRIASGIQLKDVTKAHLAAIPGFAVLQTSEQRGGGFSFTGTTSSILPEGTAVAEVRFLKGDRIVYKKQLRYGVELRAAADQRMLFAQQSVKGPKQFFDFSGTLLLFDTIQIQCLHPAAGLFVEELVLIDAAQN
jgi:hypothetical protein